MNIFSNITNSQINDILVETNLEKKANKNKSFNIKNYFKKNSKNLIFFFIDNTKEAIILYFQIIKSGNVPILLSPDLDENFITSLNIKYKPQYILSNREMNFLKDEFKFLTQLDQFKLYETKVNFVYPIHKDLCLLMTTSGSTGSPKLVKISYKNIFENTKSICKFLKINKNHITITTLQPYYTYGLSIINTHIYKKAKIIINKKSFFEKEFWNNCKKNKVNSFGAVSFMYEILKKIKFENMILPHLKYITHAGGKLPNSIHNYINNVSTNKNYKFITMYGQTEATSRISYLPWKFSKKKISSIGIPIPGVNLFIKDNKDKGEICFSGKNIMMGYANNYEDLSKNERFKKYCTGDIGKKDKDGFFYVIGRKDRFVKIFGHRINLDEVDSQIINEGLKAISVKKNENIIIYCEKDDDILKIKNFITKKLNLNISFFKIKKINKIPITKSGKISYSKLK